MDLELASMARVLPHPSRAIRADSAAAYAGTSPDGPGVLWATLVLVGLALAFIVAGASGLDLGPQEARIGLAAGERAGPMGQILGYWAPDLWPAQVLPSLALTRLTPSGRPTVGVVRWPAALAAIGAGWLLAWGMFRALGGRASILFGLCWFGSLAIIDRSAGAGIDPILGLAVLGAIDRILARGSDWIAGLWASLAFLAGGWPPLAMIALSILVIGRRGSGFSPRVLLPPTVTAIAWSVATIGTVSAEFWAGALTLPLTHWPDWRFAPGLIGFLGMPWSPFALLASRRSIRDTWPMEGRAWVTGWLQAAVAGLIAGSLVPGLAPSARMLALAGLLVGASACLNSLRRGALGLVARRVFFALFSVVLALWLVAMTYGCFIWILTMPYYRTLGIAMGVMIPVVIALGWAALATGNPRRALATLVVLSIGLKLAHWGYYAPEWNYRRSQGPWGRAIGQWIPRKWSLYVLHDWPEDLSFFIGRPVRQLRSPRFLNYLPGDESRYVLLQTQEFENWPDHAPRISVVARFHDQLGAERILARTPGFLPVPGLSTLKYSP